MSPFSVTLNNFNIHNIMDTHNQADWKMVFFSAKPYQISILTALLQDNDIESSVINKRDSMYGIGEMELYVLAKDYERAKQIVDHAGLL